MAAIITTKSGKCVSASIPPDAQYLVVQSEYGGLADLVCNVDRLMGLGYKPLGGIAVTMLDKTSNLFVQAMVK